MKRLPRPIEVTVFVVRLSLMIIWVMVAAAIALPLAIFRWKNAENNYIFAQFYGPVACKIMGIHVIVEGREHLRHRPAIFAINHQSGLDMTTLASTYPKGAVIIAKKEIRRIPVFGLMLEAFGNVMINRQDRRDSLSGLNTAVDEMKQKNVSVWIFPEGTRNASGEGLLRFKKGAFYMGIQAQAPIVPIVSSRLVRLVNFKDRYAHSGTIIVRVLPPVSTVGMTLAQVDELMETVRNQMLVALKDASARAAALDGESEG